MRTFASEGAEGSPDKSPQHYFPRDRPRFIRHDAPLKAEWTAEKELDRPSTAQVPSK